MDWLTDNWDKITTVFFAALSAVFAGLSFVVLFLDYRRNNAKVSVSIQRAVLRLPEAIAHCLNATILNKGRRPVIITGLTFLMSNGEHLQFLSTSSAFVEGYPVFPITLGEMESFSVTAYEDALESAKVENQLGIRAVCFKDTAGNIYQCKLRKKVWRELYSL